MVFLTKDGQVHTTYSTSVTFNKAKKELDIMNAEEYLNGSGEYSTILPMLLATYQPYQFIIKILDFCLDN